MVLGLSSPRFGLASPDTGHDPENAGQRERKDKDKDDDDDQNGHGCLNPGPAAAPHHQPQDREDDQEKQ